jgi:hypothetical protein
LSLDYAYIGDQGMRGVLAAIMQVPAMYDNMESYLKSSPPDYFSGGKVLGNIWKLLFDMNIAN